MGKGLLIVLSMVLLSCVDNDIKYKKYLIRDNNTHYYYTDSYTMNSNNCITFFTTCSCGSKACEDNGVIILCGSYTIIENNNYNK